MTEKQSILSDFIKTFFEKATTTRRHSKNTVLNLTEITNLVCKLRLDNATNYTEEEILDGFNENGFMILEPKDENVHAGKTTKGRFESSNGNYINVKTQNISDLVSALRKGFPLKSSSDTILRINKTKESLIQFTAKCKKSSVQQNV